MALVQVNLPWGDTEVLEGTTVGEVLRAGLDNQALESLVAAKLNHRLVGLDCEVETMCEVEPVLADSMEGEEVVRRTAALLLHGVCHDMFPELRLQVGQSLRGGYFYEVEAPGGRRIDLDALAKLLDRRFQREVTRGRQIIRMSVSLDAATHMFEGVSPIKARLLRIWPSHRVPLVSCLGFTDIRHGPYAENARSVAGYRIDNYGEYGLILVFKERGRVGTARPDDQPQDDPEHAPGQVPYLDGARVEPWQPHIAESLLGEDEDDIALFRAYAETRRWNEQVGVVTIADLNDCVLEDGSRHLVQITEGQHEKKIAELADEIAHRRARIVCVAGPSSAGKTTFVKRLSIQLHVAGITPQTLSLDDYYVDRDETPKDEHGDYDFEALEAIDLDLFHDQLSRLVKGEEVLTPIYDFKLGKRRPKEDWRPRRIGPNEVLLVEGIHGLNPQLTESIPEDQKYRIFINALTQLCIDDHNRIRTSDVRLIRRIVRDRRYRGYTAAETIARWPKVRAGEEKHIFPYQGEADAMFNSALAYETAVLKNYAYRYLLAIPADHPAQAKGYQIRRFLDLFVPVSPEHVPQTSILREFIGGSGFSYK